jgi:hypothetical protein
MQHHAEKNSISHQLVSHITSFCYHQRAALSTETFRQLTDEKYLPENNIRPVNAMILLRVERYIDENKNNNTTNNNIEQQQGGGGGGDENNLSSIQIRCVNVIAAGKKEDFRTLSDSKGWIYENLKCLSPSVLAEIIARGLILE